MATRSKAFHRASLSDHFEILEAPSGAVQDSQYLVHFLVVQFSTPGVPWRLEEYDTSNSPATLVGGLTGWFTSTGDKEQLAADRGIVLSGPSPHSVHLAVDLAMGSVDVDGLVAWRYMP